MLINIVNDIEFTHASARKSFSYPDHTDVKSMAALRQKGEIYSSQLIEVLKTKSM